MRLAITGATGFVGSHLIEAALADGHRITALTRRPQPAQDNLTWVEGALDRPDSLAALCEGCDAVIHVAGVVTGAAGAGIRRFVHISSLAAREPQLSAYGRSKCESEEPVIAAGGDWTIIRPPAIYGPRDREIFDLFRFAANGVLPLPPGGQISIIHVTDLCRLILACLDKDVSHGRTYEPDDGREGGWGTLEFARAIGRAVDKRVLLLPLPKTLLRLGVRIDRLIRGRKAKLTRDRLNVFCHPDWTASPHAHPPAELWRAHIPTEAGLAATARWYKAQ